MIEMAIFYKKLKNRLANGGKLLAVMRLSYTSLHSTKTSSAAHSSLDSKKLGSICQTRKNNFSELELELE